MMNVLRKVEDVLVQTVRVVLLVLLLLMLLGMARWLYAHYGPGRSAAASGEPAVLDWREVRPDLKYVVDETSRDLGDEEAQVPMEKRLADPALRPSFQKADGLIRGFVYQNPARRKRVEQDNGSQGLAPVHPLLKGDALPSAVEVERQIRLREARENGECCDVTDTAAPLARRIALAAGDAAPESDEDEVEAPLEVVAQIHERAQAAESEHGPGAYAAFVQDLPAALQQVFGSESVAPRLQEQPAAQIVNMVLLNYTLSFDRAAQQLKGESSDEDKWGSRLGGMQAIVWGLLIACLAMVAMVLALIRMERHLRAISERQCADKP